VGHSLFPQNAWESALSARYQPFTRRLPRAPPDRPPLIMPRPVLPLFLSSTPLLQSKSKISRSRVRHKRWRRSGDEDRAIRDRRGLVSLQLATIMTHSIETSAKKSTSTRHCNPPLSQVSCRPAGQKPHARRVQTLTLGAPDLPLLARAAPWTS
jgi:hypothetical protein